MNAQQNRGADEGAQLAAPPPRSRLAEFMVFLVLAILVWPVLAAGIVGAYGFAIWIGQVIFGPPGVSS